jgi:hypothetical protein
MEKQVGYAYPTSNTATRFGLSKTGCYFVLFLNGQHRYASKRDRGFETLQEAFDYANMQPEVYAFYSLRPDGTTPWMPKETDQ